MRSIIISPSLPSSFEGEELPLIVSIMSILNWADSIDGSKDDQHSGDSDEINVDGSSLLLFGGSSSPNVKL